MDFNEKDYYQNKFTKVTLSNEVIREIEFEECKFLGCSFIDCSFIKCNFINCEFSECILSATTPLDCRFIDTHFTNCKVIGIDWTKSQHIQDLSFNKCLINYSNFRMLKIPNTKITNSEAKKVDFIETDLSNSDLSNTDFEKSIFSKTNLFKTNLVGSKNYYIDTRNNNLKKARFSLPEALDLLNSLEIVIEQ